MERKEVVERLVLADDVNTLDLNDLANKYLCNEEEYVEFLNKYANMFVASPLYQLRAFNEYRKIAELVETGTIMYPSKENDDKAIRVLSEINYNLNSFNLKDKIDDELQAKFLLFTSIGETKSKLSNNYEQIISGMCNAALKYENKDNNSIDDFKDYIELYQYTNKNSVSKAYDHYAENHSLIDLCNNIYFLYYANLLINSYPSSVDEEFIKDVEDVILSSKVIEKAYLNKNHQTYKNYVRVAKFTEKSIKKFQNNSKKLIKM